MQKLPWFIAAVAGVGSACGEVKDNGQLADAPPAQIDAPATPIDAPPVSDIDAMPPAPVKVTVLTFAGDGAPDPSAKVLFQDAAGAVVQDGAVDAAGHAQAMLPTGGTVTTIRTTTDSATELSATVTVMTGVKPGDDLTFGIKPPPTILNQGGATTMTANFMPVSAAGAATFYNNCGASSGAADPIKGVATLTFRDSCHGATFDLLGIATGGNLPVPQFVKLTNINYQGGAAFTIPTAFGDMSDFAVNLQNLPDKLASVRVTRSSMIGNVAVAPQVIVTSTPSAGVLAVTVPYAPGFGTRSELALSMTRADATSFQMFDAHTDTLAASATLDVGALALPWISDLKATPTGATWTTVAEGATPDGMLTQWGGSWTDATGRAVSVAWRVIQPAEASGMTLPTLPAAYAQVDPSQQTVAVAPGILFVVYGDYDQVSGYDDLRRMAESFLPIMINVSGDVPSALGAFTGMPFKRRLSVATTFRRG
jgi:hypothetical protein